MSRVMGKHRYLKGVPIWGQTLGLGYSGGGLMWEDPVWDAWGGPSLGGKLGGNP